MELGWFVYNLVVFGFGGLLLFALFIYFLRELLIKRQPWVERGLGSRIVFIGAFILFALLSSVPLRMVWVTRYGAVPGRYASDGAWGHATLEIKKDGTYTESWLFQNEQNGHDEGQVAGTWKDAGRDWLTREVVLERFKPLAEHDREIAYSALTANVEGYSGRTAINVDSGADIYFWRR